MLLTTAYYFKLDRNSKYVFCYLIVNCYLHEQVLLCEKSAERTRISTSTIKLSGLIHHYILPTNTIRNVPRRAERKICMLTSELRWELILLFPVDGDTHDSASSTGFPKFGAVLPRPQSLAIHYSGEKRGRRE